MTKVGKGSWFETGFALLTMTKAGVANSRARNAIERPPTRVILRSRKAASRRTQVRDLGFETEFARLARTTLG